MYIYYDERFGLKCCNGIISCFIAEYRNVYRWVRRWAPPKTIGVLCVDLVGIHPKTWWVSIKKKLRMIG